MSNLTRLDMDIPHNLTTTTTTTTTTSLRQTKSVSYTQARPPHSPKRTHSEPPKKRRSAYEPLPVEKVPKVPSKRSLSHAINALTDLIRKPKRTWLNTTWTDEMPLAATISSSTQKPAERAENWWATTPRLSQ
ncbi:hypothetical protein PHYBLDRAFT_165191 [Phycomyces blakesleeanus NRRL 1555(-)]|uniref:Uncharacterized protein n=1 Tax=Phycomyces blakesleeanus (strain ATCC 8743b / DSM 1359 / FGSC 10004 / NBRC 33097 / NRRL 1555) TaxID=763407 RepID=A0A167NV03_PHYB8|nr:hypothetical protein PHYBLDRAFT_165191 [Phycomyces blakesleeanus NRRL 1555(-)]OAD76669.1 hypothetical protein PHYBLDRAFT_165191 [Phycomyces blakesleeanus NRRL 1555(-)]|eukprot:XP_018294709.1 hypothetical protein PHYBLDRAFT_165191 [Phycomyces blakesleeanus NRRL 1555(-)]